jgi:hypothetical protein
MYSCDRTVTMAKLSSVLGSLLLLQANPSAIDLHGRATALPMIALHSDGVRQRYRAGDICRTWQGAHRQFQCLLDRHSLNAGFESQLGKMGRGSLAPVVIAVAIVELSPARTHTAQPVPDLQHQTALSIVRESPSGSFKSV